MAPKPTQPRLADIDGEKLAKEIHEKVFSFLASRATDIGAMVVDEGQGPSTLRFTVQLLTGYAKVGLRATDWPNDGCCQDALIDVMAALYSCAGDRGTFGGGAFDLPADMDADDEIGVVLLAANARQHIMMGQSVPSKQLAALAGLNYQRIRELVRAGELPELKGGDISALQAKRFLDARGVPGFGKEGK